MEQEHSGREGNSRSVIQEIPRLLWKPTVNFLEKILKYTSVRTFHFPPQPANFPYHKPHEFCTDLQPIY
jgi:hypothetical protein